MPIGPGRDSIGVAVEASDYLQLQAWSNTACTFKAIVRVRPSSGGKTAPFPIEVAATSNRLTQSATVQLGTPGVIDSVVILATPKSGETAPTQRGQSYVQLAIVNGGCLACGYVYPGHQPALNEFVEPGPAGGPGALTRVTTSATVTTGRVVGVVPTGAIWRVILGQNTYTASATVGTRNALMRYRDASGNVYSPGVFLALTATQVGKTLLGENVGNILTATTGILGNANQSGLQPSAVFMQAGYDILALDGNSVDGLDTVLFEAQVEEWVMPN